LSHAKCLRLTTRPLSFLPVGPDASFLCSRRVLTSCRYMVPALVIRFPKCRYPTTYPSLQKGLERERVDNMRSLHDPQRWLKIDIWQRRLRRSDSKSIGRQGLVSVRKRSDRHKHLERPQKSDLNELHSGQARLTHPCKAPEQCLFNPSAITSDIHRLNQTSTSIKMSTPRFRRA
jgi:hypothetical protein